MKVRGREEGMEVWGRGRGRDRDRGKTEGGNQNIKICFVMAIIVMFTF